MNTKQIQERERYLASSSSVASQKKTFAPIVSLKSSVIGKPVEVLDDNQFDNFAKIGIAATFELIQKRPQFELFFFVA